MLYLVRFAERNPKGRTLREQHNGSVAFLSLVFLEVVPVSQILNERTIVGNGSLHLLEAHTQSVAGLPQTGNVLRKLALDLLNLLVERVDLLVGLSGKFLGRLQKQLTQLAFIQVKLLYQLLVFASLACFS